MDGSTLGSVITLERGREREKGERERESEDNFQDLVLSFYHVGAGELNSGLGANPLDLLSHLAGPPSFLSTFLIIKNFRLCSTHLHS